mmetsp:Transcript_20587/g.34465  ORF Transcript_20587/g.34465 Transcript_20587/m.34465 type:complete len:89 (-) Transcript_20587:165-431(-)
MLQLEPSWLGFLRSKTRNKQVSHTDEMAYRTTYPRTLARAAGYDSAATLHPPTTTGTNHRHPSRTSVPSAYRLHTRRLATLRRLLPCW